MEFSIKQDGDNTSTDIAEIAASLAKAQTEFKIIEKDKTADIRTKTGKNFSYSYTDLATIIEKCLPILSKNGIAVLQNTDVIENKLNIETALIHSSGQYIKGHLTLPIVKVTDDSNPIQAIGSAITYGRRYHLSAMIGVASEEDNDASNQNGPTKNAPKMPECPECKSSKNVMVSKYPKPGETYYCNRAKDGCGNKFDIPVPNTAIPDPSKPSPNFNEQTEANF